jgi:hypothetical protein
MFFSPKRVTRVILVLALFAGTMSVSSMCRADERIFTTTAEIESVKGMVIVMAGGKRFQPLLEVDIPKWAVAGARATLSYVLRSRGRCYLEIVRPGQRLKVKEEIELSQKQGY